MKKLLLLIFLLSLPLHMLCAQEKKESAYTLGGLVFGDLYHVQKHHLEEANGATGAVMRRAYLTFDAKINKNWFGRARLEMNQSGEFETYAFETEVKDLFIGYTRNDHKILLGLSPSKTFDLIEDIWGLRYLVRTPMDLQGVASRDFGLALAGPLNKKQTFRYRFMYGNGIEFGNEVGDGQKTMAAISYHPTKALVFDFYADYEKLAGETDRSTLQFFAGYKTDKLRWGLQYAYQDRQEDPTLELFSAFIVKKLVKEYNFIGRIDRVMEPSPRGNNIAYLPFDPNSKATFFVAGMEFPVHKYLTLTPNVVFTTYDKQSGAPTPSNDLHYRLTIFLNLE